MCTLKCASSLSNDIHDLHEPMKHGTKGYMCTYDVHAFEKMCDCISKSVKKGSSVYVCVYGMDVFEKCASVNE
jgi:pantothenate kinase